MEVDREIITGITLSYIHLNLATLVCLMNKRKRVRRCGVRPINKKRKTQGFFMTLVRTMKTGELDGEQFFKYTRMTKNQFSYLLHLAGPSLQKNEKKFHIPPEHRLMITIQ